MARLVWSSDKGQLCPRCGHPAERCACSAREQPAFDASRPVRVRRETKGRRGKAVTLVENLPLAAEELKALASKLKQRCSSGGTVKEGVVEIQGDHRKTAVALLREQGFEVRSS